MLKFMAAIVCCFPLLLLGAAMFSAFGEAPNRWATELSPIWVSLAGNVIGGAFTVVAAGAALLVYYLQADGERQRKAEEKRRALQMLWAYANSAKLFCDQALQAANAALMNTDANRRVLAFSDLKSLRDNGRVAPSRVDAEVALSVVNLECSIYVRPIMNAEANVVDKLNLLHPHGVMTAIDDTQQAIAIFISGTAAISFNQISSSLVGLKAVMSDHHTPPT
ncbi:hypothetical protein [Ancylobacter vacuolatus]|uniref:Uncharacterized protein n=1 Tax=Ancylobacter vacuolatus TaxID=223389 RepID=A0ABU0DMV6_9HYPH|nr:hypothetical protein [Ancylobacter vacuolatus]MDQ0349754.1 hypothetical protein [Ancylobacter vacuolatus]